MMATGGFFNLTDKVVLVTGGYGGIGEAICRAVAAAGARVAVAGQNGDKAEALALALRSEGVDARRAPFDARSTADTRRMVDNVAAEFGRLDILVNCVGGNLEERAESVTEAVYDDVMLRNLKTALFQAQAAAPHMRAAGGGKVLFIGSVRGGLALRGRGFAAYCAAKGGLTALCRQLAAEWAEHRITVNVLSPTFTRTAQAAKWLDDPAFYESVVARIPLGRVAETTDIAGAALFFVSAASDFVTGQTLYIDGGITATQ
jgi:NAD(P)-dependent dehydrogenase (short-subunit alcohol dehydrogenase family)